MAIPPVQLPVDVYLTDKSLNNLRRSLSNVRGLDVFAQASQGVRQFEGALDRANQRVVLFGASTAILYSALRGFQELGRATLTVEKNLIAINSIFKLTNTQLSQFSKDLFNVAVGTSQAFEKVADAAQEFARQGLSVTETTKRTKDAMILTRLAAVDTATAVNTLTASINGFQREALDSTTIVNKLANADAAFAVSAKDLSDSLVRVGSAASDVGVSFDQLISLVTATKQITGRDGAVIAQALNTIFTRVGRKDTQEALEGLGVQMRDLATNKALPTIQVLANFARVYDSLTGSTRTWAAELVGGVRNLNTLKAVLADLSKENSVYGQVMGVLGDKTNAAYIRNEELNKSLEATIERMSVVTKQIYSNIGNVGFSGPVKSLLNGLTNNVVTDALRDADGTAETMGGQIAQGFIKGFGNAVVFGLGPVLLKALLSISTRTFRNLIDDVKLASGLTKQQQIQAETQAQIVGLYNSGNQALMQQLANATSLTERYLILERTLQSIRASNAAFASEVAGATSFLIGRGYNPKVPRRAAGGYLPSAISAESAAISMGIGGAPAGARPVTVPNFKFGGGVIGPLVANTSEFIVPNMAGGGSAVYNREMIQKFGLPPGATPVAAGGYVPNAAGGMDSYDYSSEIAAFEAQQNRSRYNPRQYSSPAGPPFPTSAQWKKLDPVGYQRSADFERAQKELEKVAKEEARLAKMKLAQMEADWQQEESSRAVKRGLTKTEIALSEKQLRSHREEVALRQEELRAAFLKRKSVKEAPYVTAPPSGNWEAYIASLRARQVGGSFLAGDIQRMMEIEGVIPANEALMGLGKIQIPLRPPGGGTGIIGAPSAPSWISRARAQLTSPIGRVGLGIGASFLGGTVPEGKGGTASGIAGGALSNALTYGGAALSFTGNPYIGLGAAIIGGAVGAISKFNKSLDELAEEVDQFKKKLAQGTEAGVNVLRLQEEKLEALRQGNTARVQEIIRQVAVEMRQVRPEYLGLVKENLNNPNGIQNYIQATSPVNRRLIGGQNLIQELGANRSSLISETLAIFGNGVSNKNIAAGTEAFASALEQVPTEKLNALSRLLTQNPQAALKEVGNIVGAASNPDFQKSLARVSSRPYSGDFGDNSETQLVRFALRQALFDLTRGRAQGASQSTQDRNFVARELELRDLAFDYDRGARYTQLSGAAQQRLNQNRQRLLLTTGGAGELGSLIQQGGFDIENIRSQSSVEKSVLLQTGQRDLVRLLKASGADSPEYRKRIAELTSLGSVQSLKGFLDTPEGKRAAPNANMSQFLDALGQLADQLGALDETERQNIRVTEDATQTNIRLYQFSRSRGGALAESRTGLNAALEEESAARRRGEVPSILNERRLAREEAQDLLYTRWNPNTAAESGFNARQYIRNLERSVNSSAAMDQAYVQSDRGQRLSLLMTQARASGRRGQQQRLDELEITRANPYATGSDLSGAAFSVARDKGTNGEFFGSLKTGFGSVFAGLKADIKDLSQLGAQLGQSLEQNLGNAFGNFVTGTQTASQAFRSFTISVLNDAARAFASKAVQGLLGMLLGNIGFGGLLGGTGATAGSGGLSSDIIAEASTRGKANGGFVFANGGSVPALLTGGEYVFTPQQVKRLGPQAMQALNTGATHAGGGMVNGGSGIRDDVAARLQPGSYVIKKSMVQKYGADYLDHLASGGAVQRRFWGGFILPGALLGGIIGGISGGKKGALMGLVAGAALGGLGNVAGGGSFFGGTAATQAATGIGALSKVPLTMAQKLIFMGGGAAILGVAAGMAAPRNNRLMSQAQIIGYQGELERNQQAEIDAMRANGGLPYVRDGVLMGSIGGSNAGNYAPGISRVYTASTRQFFGNGSTRFADGGASGSMTASSGMASVINTPTPVFTAGNPRGGGSNVGINVTINDNGSSTSSTKSSGGGMDQQFGEVLGRRIKEVTMQTIQEQQRVGGILRPQSQMRPAYS